MDTLAIIEILSPLVSGEAYEAGASIDTPTIYVLPTTCHGIRASRSSTTCCRCRAATGSA
jgi:hypothetical protein